MTHFELARLMGKDHDYVELLGGPRDGEIVEARHGEYRIPMVSRLTSKVWMGSDTIDTTYTATRCHVYRGWQWHPDRCHSGLRYAGIVE